MFFANKKTKIVHYQQCRYVGKAFPPAWEEFSTLQEAKNAGYRLCSVCTPVRKELQENKDTIEAFCQKNGISLRIKDGNLHITTSREKWLAVPAPKHHYTLWHKNTYRDRNKYHVQKTNPGSVIQILHYVTKHEDYRYRNPLPKEKETAPPPRKGTKRYRKEMNRRKAKEKRRAIGHVLDLIEELEEN